MSDEEAVFRMTERDVLILDHVARYRLTLREIVQKLFMPDTEINAVTKVLGRLTGAGLLARHMLHDTHAYWTLSARSAALRGLDEKRALALGYQSIIEHYGILSYCCGGSILRELLTPEEFDTQFPGHSSPSITRAAYYADNHEGELRLGLILVDGGVQDPIRLLRKCHHELARRMDIPAFRERFRATGFVIAIVTPDPQRKVRLQHVLDSDQTRAVLYRVVVRSGLAQLTVNSANQRRS